ncbi:MAG: DUF2470 domain-containing protein [Rhodospirillaceae bacterium]|jgi:heme iron utilization protein|nr:DUF2470 domain-containing protein [Rhodospirillaceae bacterium]MBT5664107.1 DUF2470 domain-containing protein [Rhodospirillaceae bacterium]MBT5809028.1 DUF2470 domain-containing protein [Rhodospirillaceae bacterium]
MIDEDSSGALARRLIRSRDRAVLATRGADDWPYASLVMTATTHAGAPVLLLSDLAEHTRNLRLDDRISLLFDGTGGLDDPLTGARVSVQGRAIRSASPHDRSRFLARHASARDYADFGDFNIFEIAVDRAHLVAGFGKIEWLSAADILLDGDSHNDLMATEEDILSHMNADHHDAIQLYATALLGFSGSDWRLSGIDPEGADLAHKGLVSRVEFSERVQNADDVRREFVRLAEMARNPAKNNFPGQGVDG